MTSLNSLIYKMRRRSVKSTENGTRKVEYDSFNIRIYYDKKVVRPDGTVILYLNGSRVRAVEPSRIVKDEGDNTE